MNTSHRYGVLVLFMENHPIPQDVTGFKFKLIGSVTVKQFLYLILGGIFAAVCFMLPITAFIKYPLVLLFGGVGAALAFIPIEGRPMDVMLKNFAKTLPSENEYIYKKRGAEALILDFFTPKTAVSIKSEQVKTDADNALDARRALLYKTLKRTSRPDEKEEATLTSINAFLHDSSAHSASPSVQNVDAAPKEYSPTSIVAPIPQKSAMDLENEVKVVMPTSNPLLETPITKPSPPVQNIEQQATEPVQSTPVVMPIPVAQPSVTPQPAPIEPPSPHVTQAPVEPVTTESIPLQVVTPQQPTPAATTPTESATVTTVGPESSLKAGFPQLPDTPNIVMGIIKDPRGKIIPNILVEIMDVQGIPVRAFKTNALGQFAAATPLPNGEYNVLLEDPRKQNEFGQIHIVLDGTIFNPLEIISVDQRERLRRELFGGNTTAPQAAA